MCGRFVLKAPVAEIKDWFGTANAPPEAGPRYNVAPTQNELVPKNWTDGLALALISNPRERIRRR